MNFRLFIRIWHRSWLRWGMSWKWQRLRRRLLGKDFEWGLSYFLHEISFRRLSEHEAKSINKRVSRLQEEVRQQEARERELQEIHGKLKGGSWILHGFTCFFELYRALSVLDQHWKLEQLELRSQATVGAEPVAYNNNQAIEAWSEWWYRCIYLKLLLLNVTVTSGLPRCFIPTSHSIESDSSRCERWRLGEVGITCCVRL